MTGSGMLFDGVKAFAADDMLYPAGVLRSSLFGDSQLYEPGGEQLVPLIDHLRDFPSGGCQGEKAGVIYLNMFFFTKLGSVVAWLFIPRGWGNWQAAVASITGLVAKESIVSTLGILYGGGEGTTYGIIAAAFTTAGGFSFLVFKLLCAPCFAWLLLRRSSH